VVELQVKLDHHVETLFDLRSSELEHAIMEQRKSLLLDCDKEWRRMLITSFRRTRLNEHEQNAIQHANCFLSGILQASVDPGKGMCVVGHGRRNSDDAISTFRAL
jgi:hypothetical protein